MYVMPEHSRPICESLDNFLETPRVRSGHYRVAVPHFAKVEYVMCTTTPRVASSAGALLAVK